MQSINKCIKEEKPLELTLNDCLSCSGCITDTEKSSIFLTNLPELKKCTLEKEFLISPFSKLNIYNHFLALGHKFTYSDFESFLSHFFYKNNLKLTDTSFYLNDILKNIKKELILKNKLIVSDCPGVVKYIERNGHHLIDFLSQVYSPQEVALISSTRVKVSVIPCLDKKLEQVKADYYITTTEFVDYLEFMQFKFENKLIIEKNKSNFRKSFSGGYTEFIINELNEEFTVIERNKGFIIYQSEKYTLLKIYGLKNLLNFINLTRKEFDFNFAEIFLCENACVSGPTRIKLNLQNEVKAIEEEEVTDKSVGIDCFGKVFEVKKVRKVNFKVEW